MQDEASSTDMVQYLIAMGAPVRAKNVMGETPVDFARALLQLIPRLPKWRFSAQQKQERIKRAKQAIPVLEQAMKQGSK